MSLRRIFSIITLGFLFIWSLPVFSETGKNIPGPFISEPVSGGNFFQMFLGLLFVVGIIFGLAWFIRRMGTFQQASHGALRILGGLSVGQRERIVLVQVGDKQLLLGLAPGNIRTLHVLDEPIVMKQQSHSVMSFADRLQSVIQGRTKR